MSNQLHISLLQTSLHWEDKPANLEMLEKKIMSIRDKTEIVVLPEMFSTGFSMNPSGLAETMEEETITWMKKVAAEKKIILTGSMIARENDHFYNRLIWMLPTGEFGTYDKRHLFGYANEDQFYQRGERRFIASVKGWKVNLLVCYDLRFPIWSRQSPAIKPTAEYDVLIYVANWPEKRNHAWKTLLQARAIENQCYVIGVNRVGNDGNGIYHSGDSMVVDPLGEILYTKAHEEDIFTIALDRQHLEDIRSRLPFLKDADDFLIEP